MRRFNTKFNTKFLSEAGARLLNRDYFAYVELDDFACYVIADSLDEDKETNSAKIVVGSLLRDFTEHPSLGTGSIKRYIKNADKELKKANQGMRLKASAVIVITDYRKLRYCGIGNSRFYLLRNDRFLVQSADQSLTRNLIDEEKLEKDKAAVHEERNNLYSYLGEGGNSEIHVSKKIKLEDGDIVSLFTRGIWECCIEIELLEVLQEAKDPQEVLDNVEELILCKQPDEIDNYTLAVTFINKVYQKPKKKFPIKKVLMIFLAVFMVVLAVGLPLFIRHYNKVNQTKDMKQYMESGERYLTYDNYKKASQEYTQALKLARKLKKEKEIEESDQYTKLSDQILLADEKRQDEKYQEAALLYQKALSISYQAGNVGRNYIESQLDQTNQLIEVYDLLEEGERKEEKKDLNGAVKCYKKAKEQAVNLYFKDGKKEAAEKITAVEETLLEQQKEKEDKKQKAAEEKTKKEEEAKTNLKKEVDEQVKEEMVKQELLKQEKLDDQKNALELESKGNELLKNGEYESAVTYFKTAQTVYISLEMADRADDINEKIAAAQTCIKQAKELEEKKAKEQELEEKKAKEEENE